MFYCSTFITYIDCNRCKIRDSGDDRVDIINPTIGGNIAASRLLWETFWSTEWTSRAQDKKGTDVRMSITDLKS